jgi:NTE family protein
MPFCSEGLQAGIGLALSGGGFRATLFHAGALLRLNQLGYLERLDRISSVSGGSITAGMLALKWDNLKSANFDQDTLVRQVIEPLKSFCKRNVDVPSIIKGLLVPWKSVSEYVAAQYSDGLYGRTTLQQLPDPPRFIFNSTNLATGIDFRFSKPYAGDYRIGLINNPGFTVAQAVAASSAFPPVLSPVVLEPNPDLFESVPGADLFEDVTYRRRLLLTDGGVYDNLGLETVQKRLKTLLVSDAGAPFDYGRVQGKDWPRETLRVINVLSHQAWSLRTSLLVRMYQGNEREGAYWGIGTPISDYKLPDALSVPPEVTERLAKIRTRLNAFNDEEQCTLINWGYAACDGAVRKYTRPPKSTVPQWPYPNYALSQGVPAGVKANNTPDFVQPVPQPKEPPQLPVARA